MNNQIGQAKELLEYPTFTVKKLKEKTDKSTGLSKQKYTSNSVSSDKCRKFSGAKNEYEIHDFSEIPRRFSSSSYASEDLTKFNFFKTKLKNYELDIKPKITGISSGKEDILSSRPSRFADLYKSNTNYDQDDSNPDDEQDDSNIYINYQTAQHVISFNFDD